MPLNLVLPQIWTPPKTPLFWHGGRGGGLPGDLVAPASHLGDAAAGAHWQNNLVDPNEYRPTAVYLTTERWNAEIHAHGAAEFYGTAGVVYPVVPLNEIYIDGYCHRSVMTRAAMILPGAYEVAIDFEAQLDRQARDDLALADRYASYTATDSTSESRHHAVCPFVNVDPHSVDECPFGPDLEMIMDDFVEANTGRRRRDKRPRPLTPVGQYMPEDLSGLCRWHRKQQSRHGSQRCNGWVPLQAADPESKPISG